MANSACKVHDRAPKGTAAPAHTPPQGPKAQVAEPSLRREVTSLPARLRPSFHPLSSCQRVAQDAPPGLPAPDRTHPSTPPYSVTMLLLPPPRIPPLASLPAALPSLQSAGHRPASREHRCGPADSPCACVGRGAAARPQPRSGPSGWCARLGKCSPRRLLQASSPPPGPCFWRRIRDPKWRSPKARGVQARPITASLARLCPEVGGSSASRMRKAWAPRRLQVKQTVTQVGGRASRYGTGDPWRS